jgi:iron-sulfur cluster assembly protein CyaY
MDRTEFLRLTDDCLTKVAKWLEDFDPDELDYTSGDGVVTIEFADGARFILSRQAATSQLWLAAESHGFHYSYDPGRDTWIDDKDAHELYPKLAELISQKLGREVEL